MRCAYCYYLDKARFYDLAPKEVMNERVLKNYIKDVIEANDTNVISFCWHGGEPLLAGVEFYQKALFYQQKYAQGKRIENAIQTNGLLVNEQWCKFFRDNGFLVGISLDGPEDVHDAYRFDAGHRGTYHRVLKSVEMLRDSGVEFNTMSVVNNLSEGRGAEIYDFFKSIGSRYMQFLPAVEFMTEARQGSKRGEILAPEHALSGRLTPWSVSAEGYGKFMCEVFDRWRSGDVGEYYVQLFDVTLANWYGEESSGLCSHSRSCGDGLAVEHNGDVYSCDHFVYPEYKLGNLLDNNIKDMYRSTAQFEFGVNKRNGLPDECLNCDYYKLCYGGCPKYRFREGEDELQKNYLCEGYRIFFAHSAPYMRRMCEFLDKGQPPSLVMSME